MTVQADRWIEVDLYWFDLDDIAGSAQELIERVAPLLRVEGWRGVIVNTGWLVDYVLDWRGDLNRRIPFPAGIRRDPFFTDTGPLTGTTAERKQQWRDRFARRAHHDAGGYPDWTYHELAMVAAHLRAAADRHGIAGLRVGTFVLGWESIYRSEPSAFARQHPEAFRSGPWPARIFDVTARLTADRETYGGFPNGIPAGTPITDFFGAQWGSLSTSVGLDAIVLRDSMIGPGVYDRVGPYGDTAPSDPALVAAWSVATGELIRHAKQANPDALVIGYSSAASAVADWRVNCVDLESIAGAGFLDAFIDQTWAGAWNEVGQRPSTFWNRPSIGWTYQLTNVLVHAAVLTGTGVRHYTLAETFDAWESWDIIHTAPDRLRWGIWAYLHAFLKTPNGLKAPDGTYVSWANQGKQLLSEQDVEWLAATIDTATADARATSDVLGPTLVYHRPALEHQVSTAPHHTIKEWIDEQAGSLLKWGAPICSITRSEYLGDVDSDLFVMQTPTQLSADTTAWLEKQMKDGTPLALFGSPYGGLDPNIAELIGSHADNSAPTDIHLTAWRANATPQEAADIPATFSILHLGADTAAPNATDAPPTLAIARLRPDRTSSTEARAIYSVAGSPCLVRAGNVLFWDPPDFQHSTVDGVVREFPCSMPEAMGSPYPFVLAARALHEMLVGTRSPVPDHINPDRPATALAWEREGEIVLLAADLEEGFRDSTDGVTTLRLRVAGRTVDLTLRYAESTIMTIPVAGDTA